MGVKGKNPHNALVLDTFSQIEHASGLLAAVRSTSWTPMSAAGLSGGLEPQHRDVHP